MTTNGAQSAKQARQTELILERIDRLPTLSPVAVRLISIVSSDDADLDEIVPLIESDPALSATVLSLCRRADTGLGDKITTVRHAIVMLGLETVQSVVLSVAVYGLVRDEQQGCAESGLDHEGLWKHLIATGCASELLAKHYTHLSVKPGTAFVSGLLHELGTIVLDLVLPKAFAGAVRASEARRSPVGAITRKVLGIDQNTAARRVAQRWGLPDAVQEVLWLCAQPWEALPETPNRNLVAVVTLARDWARAQHLGWACAFDEPWAHRAMCGPLRIDPASLEALSVKLIHAVSERCSMLGLGDQSDQQLLIESLGRANERLGQLNESLGEKARLGERRKMVLDEIGAFMAAAGDTTDIHGVLGCVVRSAARVFNNAEGSRWWVLIHEQEGEPWRLDVFDSGGVRIESEPIEPPAGGMDAKLPGIGSGAFSLGSLGAMAWLGDAIGDGVALTDIRVLPLLSADGATGVLLYEYAEGETGGGLTRDELGSLGACWGAATAAGWRQERSERLGERLVEVNRELVGAQAKLLESETLARLGELSAGAAHEMNNPLTVIRGRGQMLVERLEAGRDRAAAASIAEAADALTELISSLHLLSDPPEARLETLDPKLIVRLAIEMAREQLGERGGDAAIRVEAQEGAGACVADLELMARGVCELVVNAIQAGGVGPIRVVIEPDATAGPEDGRWCVSVFDQGTGLSEKALKHAFDPFFSEKRAGRRTGLGLCRARGLIERCGGGVSLANARGRGAVATVWMPMSRAEPERLYRKAA